MTTSFMINGVASLCYEHRYIFLLSTLTIEYPLYLQNYRIAGNFQGENFREFRNFVAIHG